MTTATEVEHGTYYAYRYKRCRCDACLAGNAIRQLERAEARREYNRNRWHETYAEQREYLVSQKRRWDAKNRRMVPNARNGHWTAAEDAIVVREDISTREKSAMLHRNYASIANRKRDLLSGTTDSCKHCGKVYPKVRASKSARPFYSRGLYCSRACAYAQQKAESAERNMRQCDHCGRGFRGRARGSKFCSQQCSGAAHVKHPEAPCLECGKTFKPVTTWSTRHGRTVTKFCSMRCAGEARRRETTLKHMKKCLHCGKEFRSDGRTRTCSRECGKHIRPDARPELKCECCGQGFRRSPQVVGRTPRFCSMECRKAFSRRECVLCGAAYKPHNTTQKFCSRSCAAERRRQDRGLVT